MINLQYSKLGWPLWLLLGLFFIRKHSHRHLITFLSFLHIQNALGNNEKGDIFVFIFLSEQYFSRFLNGKMVVDWEQLGRWIISNWKMISGGNGNTLQFVVFVVKVGMVLVFRVRDAITIIVIVFVIGLAIVIIVSIICMEKMASNISSNRCMPCDCQQGLQSKLFRSGFGRAGMEFLMNSDRKSKWLHLLFMNFIYPRLG